MATARAGATINRPAMGSSNESELLVRRVALIVDPALRTAYVRHTLLGMRPEEVAEVFLVARSGAEEKRRGHVELLQSVTLALAAEGSGALRTAVRDALVERGQEEAALALFDTTEPDVDEALRIPDFGAGRVLALGERKALARRADREIIERVLRDPHPDVIRILLHNPNVTETQVVLLCARRPVVADVLREVFRSPRWVIRDRVRVALLLNPWTPLDMALQVAPLVRTPDLRRALAASDLAPELRAACERLLARGAPASLH